MAPLSMRPRRSPMLATAALVFLISILSIEIADPMLVKRILAINGYEIALANLPNRGSPNVLVVDEPDIQREVAAATAVSLDQAVNISEECFQDALESPKPQITAKCIIFDNAVLIWASRSEDDGTIPIYFRIERSRARYLDALSRWDADNDAVLAQLRAAPLRAMLTQIRSTQPVARSFETQQRVQEAAAVLDRPTAVPEVENPVLGRSKIRASQLTKNKLNTAAQEIDQ